MPYKSKKNIRTAKNKIYEKSKIFLVKLPKNSQSATLYFDGCVTVSTTEKILSCIGRTTFEGERSVCVNLLLTQKSEGKPLARLVLPTVLLLAHLPLGKYVPRLSGPQMFTFTIAHDHQTRVEGISSMIANLPSSAHKTLMGPLPLFDNERFEGRLMLESQTPFAPSKFGGGGEGGVCKSDPFFSFSLVFYRVVRVLPN